MYGKKTTALLFMCAMVVLVACRKDETEQGRLTMHMQDSPSSIYQQVNIDVQGVEVFTGSGEQNGGWVSIGVTPGIYDLLTLMNGTDVLIADHDIPVGFVSQIRLKLGNNNSLVVNNQAYTMDVPSGNTSGLKINVHEGILPGRTTELYLDFDAQRSIVDHGNGTYSLKPVIRAFTLASTGGVSGTLNVAGPGISATLENGTDVYSTMIDATTGYFQVRGAKPGTYTLVIESAAVIRPVKVTGIIIAAGTINDIGVVTMPL